MQSGAPVPNTLLDGATRFLAWWRDELRGLLPESLVASFAGAGPKVVLAQVDDGFEIIDGTGGRSAAMPALSRPEALSRLAQMAAARTATSVGIRLPLSQC